MNFTNCKNCNTQLQPESEFCHACGGKVIRKRLSFKNLFEHISETFFNYDNKLLRTFIDLFKRPEAVIDGYVNGIRKRYVNPLSFFGVSLTLTGLSLFIIQKFYTQYFDYSKIFDSEIFNNPSTQQMLQESNSWVFEYNSLIYAFMIPFMAIISVIVFFNKHYNFTEHIIIYLYSMSAMMIFSTVIGQMVLFIIPEKYISFSIIFYLILFIYHGYLLKRVFKLNGVHLLLKTLFFLAVFVAAYLMLSILMGILLILTGAIDLSPQ
ncbi:MAG: DUF3667 domain-containing protein [Winogradskyella sp.]|nr:DUF3667 domain-containing protein [Winogradskyella sp.]